jgi:methylmalonyl-CoA mutase C-terminal domain/subunit
MTMASNRKARVLVAKHMLEGHDRGGKALIRMLRDEGVEVIYIIYGVPEDVVMAAKQEDADVIGLSFFSGGYLENVPRLLKLMKQNNMNDVLVVVGGLIPDVDGPELLKMGVKGVYGPGADLTGFIDLVKSHAQARA